MRARIKVGGIRAYRLFGTIGLVIGLALVSALAAARDVPLRTWGAVALAVPVSFFVALRLSYILFGRERIVFYEKTLFAVAAVFLITRSALAIDLAVLGIGAFLVFGRVG